MEITEFMASYLPWGPAGICKYWFPVFRILINLSWFHVHGKISVKPEETRQIHDVSNDIKALPPPGPLSPSFPPPTPPDISPPPNSQPPTP